MYYLKGTQHEETQKLWTSHEEKRHELWLMTHSLRWNKVTLVYLASKLLRTKITTPEESFIESEGEDIYDYIGATIATPTFDYFEQVLDGQTVHRADHDTMTTMLEKVQAENAKLKQIVSQQQEQLGKFTKNKDQLSFTVSNLTSLLITQSDLMWQIGEGRDSQFRASMEYTYVVFVQRVPQPVILLELEAPSPPIQQENLGAPDPCQKN